MRVSFLVILLLSAIAVQSWCPTKCDICLWNWSFKKGAVRIAKNNVRVCIMEDIIFEPDDAHDNPTNPHVSTKKDTITAFPVDPKEFVGCEKMKKGPYSLGYFAALVIEANYVTVDLRNHEMKQSFSFFIQQRWFSLIEIGSSPFVALKGNTGKTQGPNNFLGNEKFKKCHHIVIKNGKLGLTSHHGIHSNDASFVKVYNLKIYDFEVGGIQFNGFKNIKLKNLDIGPSVTNLPVTGHYSASRYVLGALLKSGLHKDNVNSIPFNGKKKTYKQIFNDLNEVLSIAYRYATNRLSKSDYTNPLWKQFGHMYINKERIPDGSAVYGIFLHNRGFGIHGFGTSKLAYSKSAYMKNIRIHDLAVATTEYPTASFRKCYGEKNRKKDGKFLIRGPFGDLCNWEQLFGKKYKDYIGEGKFDVLLKRKVKYVGNPLANAQIALGLLKYDNNIGKKEFAYGTSILEQHKKWEGQNSDNPFLQWVLHDKPLPECSNNFICNGDIMFHNNKGIIGIRLDKIRYVKMKNVWIENLHNKSPLVSNACKQFTGRHDGGNPHQLDLEGGMLGDVRAISIHDSDVHVTGKRIRDFYNYFNSAQHSHHLFNYGHHGDYNINNSPQFNNYKFDYKNKKHNTHFINDWKQPISQINSKYGFAYEDYSQIEEPNQIFGLTSDWGDVTAVHLLKKSYLRYRSHSSSFKMDPHSFFSGAKLDFQIVNKLKQTKKTPFPNNFLCCQYIVKGRIANRWLRIPRCEDPVRYFFPAPRRFPNNKHHFITNHPHHVNHHHGSFFGGFGHRGRHWGAKTGIDKPLSPAQNNINDVAAVNSTIILACFLFAGFVVALVAIFAIICWSRHKSKGFHKISSVSSESDSESERLNY